MDSTDGKILILVKNEIAMKVSAKTEYACIAMLELAAQYGSNEPVRIRRIAERHDVPPRFLVQILLQLKGAGLVASVRGAAGGYHLIKTPQEISLGQVMEVIEGSSEENGQNVQRLARFSGRQSADASLERGHRRTAEDAGKHYIGRFVGSSQSPGRANVPHLILEKIASRVGFSPPSREGGLKPTRRELVKNSCFAVRKSIQSNCSAAYGPCSCCAPPGTSFSRGF